LFIGAGERLLAYDLKNPRRIWEDRADYGFWRWHRHEGFVLMAAELEFAVWLLNGQKLWTTFVEPPWDFQVSGSSVRLDVMGQVNLIDLRHCPEAKKA
jgi:hypothetical protein